MSTVNQKEYLKKYLSIGSEPGKKKKRKKKSGISDRVKIIDDNIDIVTFNEAVEEDLHGLNEDAPQIVGVIDDRPPELRIKDYRESDLWKPVGSNTIDLEESASTNEHSRREESSRLQKNTNKNDAKVTSDDYSPPRKRNYRDNDRPSRKQSDFSPNRRSYDNRSPIRRSRRGSDISPERSARDVSPARRNRRDVSPIRKNRRSDSRNSDGDVSPVRRYRKDRSPKMKRIDDISPHRRNRRDVSPKRKNTDDISPHRNRRDISPKRKHTDISPKKRNINDMSPPRRNREDISPRRKNTDVSPKRRNTNDITPPRRNREDVSPKRKNIDVSARRNMNDITPPRRNRDDISPRKKYTDISPKRKNANDITPPRRNRDISPKRRIDSNSTRKPERYHDVSPSRRPRTDNDSTPLRRNKRFDRSPIPRNPDYGGPSSSKRSPVRKTERTHDISPNRKSRRDHDISPRSARDDRSSNYSRYSPKRDKRYNEDADKKYNKKDESPRRFISDKDRPKSRKSRWDVETDNTKPPEIKKSRWDENIEKIILPEAKKSGLQRANELMLENEFFRNHMEETASAGNVAPIVRDRKTGKIRDFKLEAEEAKKKQEKEDELKAKYDRWGKGLKQVDDAMEQLNSDIHEMNKPLARYADDEDLEKHLKEKEREGDPMLAYLRKKKKKKDVETGKPIKPQFEGEFMPNRYGIRPGHRWDGVDRSNGYEKKWFEVMNSRRAQQEDAYKWSTEDM